MKEPKHRRGLSLALAGIFLLGCLPLYGLRAGAVEAERGGKAQGAAASITGRKLVTPKCQVTVSSDAGGSDGQPSAHYAVDGITNQPQQWASEDMKTSSATQQDAQTPQWLTVDLGESVTQAVEVEAIQLWYNMKVWPMVYEIQTSSDNGQKDGWTTLVRVERDPFEGGVKNRSGQDIADEKGNATPSKAANLDTITRESTPGLAEGAAVERYVRFYVEKVNTAAPGNNVCLREIQVYAKESVDLKGELAKVQVSNPKPEDVQISLRDVSGANLVVRGSSLENVVANDGAISHWNIGQRDVKLLLRLSDQENQDSYVQKNVTVTVPDHSSSYPKEWFPTVSNPNPKPEVIPTIQEWYGYQDNFTLTAGSKVILNDRGNVGLVKVAQNLVDNIQEISGLTLTVETGTAPTGSHDIYIESLTEANAYDVGEEGYVMVTNDHGLHIYAPTYTGCLYGAITAQQILWQAQDHVSIPKGIMRDYPAYKVRGIMLDVARTPYRYQQLKDYAKIMLWYKMNEFHLHVNDNDNANIGSASMNTHAGFHRLESEEFPSLTSETKHAGIPADLIHADYYNNNPDYQGNPTYTKDQWRELTKMCGDMGMYVLTELDMPGHSLVYNKYAAKNPDKIQWLAGGTMLAPSTSTLGNQLELLDLTGKNKDRALRFASTLWDEYTRGEDPVVCGNVVHIGADEYWVHNQAANNAFAKFADAMRQTIQKNLGSDTKIRMWGASTGSFANAQKALGKTAQALAKDYQLDIWHTSYEHASERVAEGYQVINCRDAFLYANPGRTNRDVPNAEYLFYDWNPTNFGGYNTLVGEPNLLGAKGVVWGDQSQEGMTEKDIHQRVLRTVSILSEKTWGGTDQEDTFTQYELRAARLAEGPGTQIAMEVDSASSLVLDYNFQNLSQDGTKVYDASGNGYDATLTGGSASDGWLTFNGSTLLKTPLKTLSYPYTVSLDLKLSAQDGTANSPEASLFSGYDGRIQVAGHNGKLSADVNYFTRDLGYQVPTDGTPVNLTIVGTFQATRLYVNGKLVTFLSQKKDQDGVAPNAVSTLYSSVLLPLEKIGQDFHGQMANLKVYNKALSAQEVAGTDNGLVNVAQNAYAGGDSYRSSDAGGQDNGVQRISVAMKAVDGEAFTSEDDASSEIYSYWQGDHGDSSLTVDLGQVRTISQVDLQWRKDGVGRDIKIMSSLDGKSWTQAKAIAGNTSSRQSVTLDQAVQARFVKMQGNQSNGVYKLQEMLVYEQVDKAGLNDLLAKAQEMVAQHGLRFEAQGSQEERVLFEAVVLARALSGSPLATRSEVEQSRASLEAAMEHLSAEPEPKPTPQPTTEPTAQPTTQPIPGGSESPAADGNPLTGDQNNVVLWISLLVVCAVVVAIVVHRARSKKNQNSR